LGRDLEAVEIGREAGRIGLEQLVLTERLRLLIEERHLRTGDRIDGGHLRVTREGDADLSDGDEIARVAMDVLTADTNLTRRLALDAGRPLVGVRLFKVLIDAGDRAAKTVQLGALFTGLEHMIVVAVDPAVGGGAKVVLVRAGYVAGARRVVVTRVSALDGHGVGRQRVVNDADPRRDGIPRQNVLLRQRSPHPTRP